MRTCKTCKYYSVENKDGFGREQGFCSCLKSEFFKFFRYDENHCKEHVIQYKTRAENFKDV